ncbi:zinc finger-containing ubiquitin peptidase 1-like [Haliotis rufescens]|uniref:zinc finger-containing ubiquitin peptidase 1-like n=1 Tax=Haliotis rufescens TaxID=6454 RepID=UPI001EB0503F|nr:zinc finger-containing ubiquitin peptidase 1-like [Haliotis rufescens]
MAEGRVGDTMESDNKDETFTCILCGKAELSEDEMKFHIMVEHIEENVCCPFCDQNCLTPEKLNCHINDEHMDLLSPVNRDSDEFPEASGTNGEMVIDKSDTEFDNIESSKVIINYVNDSDSSEQGNPHEDGSRTIVKQNEKNIESSQINSQDDVTSKIDVKRSKLYLDVPKSFNGAQQRRNKSSAGSEDTQTGPVVSLATPDHTFHCPICSYSTNSEVLIQQHVNRDHRDILSPMKAQEHAMSEDKYDMLYSCPICGMSFDTPRTLELHINSKHVDILSPNSCNKQQPTTPGAQSASSGENGDLLYCPVCDQEFGDTLTLSAHVDGHFSAEQTPVAEMSDALLAEELQRCETASVSREKKDFQMLQAMYGMDEKASYKQQYEKSLERAVWKGDLTISEFYQQKTRLQASDMNGVDDGHSCTRGIIPHLQQFYRKCPGFVNQAWLCSAVDHYSGSYGDKGWGCGYRNLQMLLSSLSSDPNFCKVLFNGRPLIPSIPKIQRLIEAAWEKGFDKQGCEQLGGRVANTRKWIGATEIVATLSSLKMKCQLIDFHSPSGPDGTHPKLFQWVKEYFSRPGAFKPPLYLQHQGHSRTIVGYEEMRDKTGRLLIFDPSTPKKQMIQFTGFINGNMMRTLRRNINGLRAKQYQLVAVVAVLSDKEYEESKVMKSERIS